MPSKTELNAEISALQRRLEQLRARLAIEQLKLAKLECRLRISNHRALRYRNGPLRRLRLWYLAWRRRRRFEFEIFGRAAAIAKRDRVNAQLEDLARTIPEAKRLYDVTFCCECGQQVSLRVGYRCPRCHQWYCLPCAIRHFGQWPELHEGKTR